MPLIRTQSRDGFTLISALVTLAITGVILMSMMRVLATVGKGQAHLQSTETVRNSLTRAWEVLSTTDNCTASFGGRTFRSTPDKLIEETLPNESDPSPLGVRTLAGVSIFSVGTSLDVRTRLLGLKLQHFIQIAPSKYLADLQIQTNSPQGFSLVRTIPIRISTTSAGPATERILSCTAARGPATLPSRPTFCGASNIAYNGDMGGVVGVKNICEATCGPGADICSLEEVMRNTKPVSELNDGDYWALVFDVRANATANCDDWSNSRTIDNGGKLGVRRGFRQIVAKTASCGGMPHRVLCCGGSVNE